LLLQVLQLVQQPRLQAQRQVHLQGEVVAGIPMQDEGKINEGTKRYG
jgi:hypothetical protein